MAVSLALPGQLRPLRYWPVANAIMTAHNREIPFADAPILALRLNRAAETAEAQGDRMARVYKAEAKDLARAYVQVDRWRKASFPFFRRA